MQMLVVDDRVEEGFVRGMQDLWIKCSMYLGEFLGKEVEICRVLILCLQSNGLPAFSQAPGLKDVFCTLRGNGTCRPRDAPVIDRSVLVRCSLVTMAFFRLQINGSLGL